MLTHVTLRCDSPGCVASLTLTVEALALAHTRQGWRCAVQEDPARGPHACPRCARAHKLACQRQQRQQRLSQGDCHARARSASADSAPAPGPDR